MAPKAELREFLKSRRDRLRPEDVGGPSGGQRRVPGLRREELAMLAGVSVDYYVRLEQGRDLTPSESVLDALPRALRLEDTERALLRALARPPRIPFVAPDAGATTTEVRPSVGMLIDGLDQPAAHTATPDVDSLGTDLGDRYGSGRGTSGTVKAPIDEETKPAQ